MAIRFASFEQYKAWLADKTTGKVSSKAIFLAGLGAGTTEAVAVVCPMEVVKNSSASTDAQSCRPARRAEIQKCSSRTVPDLERRRPGDTISWCCSDRTPASYQSRFISHTYMELKLMTIQLPIFTAYTELKKYLLAQQNLKELPSYQAAIVGRKSSPHRNERQLIA